MNKPLHYLLAIALMLQIPSNLQAQNIVNDFTTAFTHDEEEEFVCYRKVHRNIYFYLSGVLLGAMGLAVVGFVVKRRDNKKLFIKNSEIERQKSDIEEKSEVIELSNKKLSHAYSLITDSLRYASKLQQAILPSKNDFEKHFAEVALFYQPKDIVSGDFFWFHDFGDEVLFAVGDCTGHGVPASLLSILGHDLMEQIVLIKKITEPDNILHTLDNEFKRILKSKADEDQLPDGMDIAVCRINFKDQKIRLAGAKLPIYLIRAKGELEKIPANRVSIGGFETLTGKSFELQEIDYHKGDVLFLLSDGYCDQFSEQTGKKFSTAKFRNLLIEIKEQPLARQETILKETFNQWKGKAHQTDDVMVLGLRF